MLLVILVGLLLTAWSWLTWPDVLVDFGRELYVPWRLVSGQVLYRDIAYFNGPFSPYFNALWFRLFGTSVQTIVFCNLALLTIFTCVAYSELVVISDVFSATIASCVFLTTFAFAQLVETGNYNFVCPYSHELTHGLFLSVGVFYGMARYLNKPQARHLATLGLCLGILFLTKVEIFAAATGATVVSLWVTWRALRFPFAEQLRLLGLLIGVSVIPPLLALGLLSTVLPPRLALQGLISGWSIVCHPEIISLYFYRWVLGIGNWKENLWQLLLWCSVYLTFFGSIAVLCLRQRRGRFPCWVYLGVGGAVTVFFLLLWRNIMWGGATRNILRPLPVMMGIMCMWWLLDMRKRWPEARQAILRFTATGFALGLMGKMIFNVHAYHYGFALAMPAALLWCLALLQWIPAWLRRRKGDGRLFRAVSTGLIFAVAVSSMRTSNYWFGRKGFRVGTGRDHFFADTRGIFVQEMLTILKRETRPEDTLSVLPEGVMLNYLARRKAPTPYINFMPVELLLYGEKQILAAFQVRAPDYIVLTHKDTREYGFQFFGRDYGQRIYAWIQANYEPVALVGAVPLQDERFGILLLKRVGPRAAIP